MSSLEGRPQEKVVTVKRPWAGQALRAVAAALTAVLLAGCLELDVKEVVEVDGSIVSGEFRYTLVIPEDLEEIDPEGAAGLGECLLPSAGDPLPPGAGRGSRELGEVADLLGLEKTQDSDELSEGMLEALLGSVQMTSTVSGEGVIAEGYARQADGSWRWSGTFAEILQARPRYWIPG